MCIGGWPPRRCTISMIENAFPVSGPSALNVKT
jgi:hypothetical protein